MMRALHGQADAAEANVMFLADRLGQLPASVRAMPNRDVQLLSSFYRAKGAIRDAETKRANGNR